MPFEVASSWATETTDVDKILGWGQRSTLNVEASPSSPMTVIHYLAKELGSHQKRRRLRF